MTTRKRKRAASTTVANKTTKARKSTITQSPLKGRHVKDGFSTLPPELRSMIYKYLLLDVDRLAFEFGSPDEEYTPLPQIGYIPPRNDSDSSGIDDDNSSGIDSYTTPNSASSTELVPYTPEVRTTLALARVNKFIRADVLPYIYPTSSWTFRDRRTLTHIRTLLTTPTKQLICRLRFAVDMNPQYHLRQTLRPILMEFPNLLDLQLDGIDDSNDAVRYGSVWKPEVLRAFEMVLQVCPRLTRTTHAQRESIEDEDGERIWDKNGNAIEVEVGWVRFATEDAQKLWGEKRFYVAFEWHKRELWAHRDRVRRRRFRKYRKEIEAAADRKWWSVMTRTISQWIPGVWWEDFLEDWQRRERKRLLRRQPRPRQRQRKNW